MAKEFQLIAGHPALDFANTLDYRYDPDRLIELLPTYERFLALAVQTETLTRQQARKLLTETDDRQAKRALKRAIELREAIYFLFQSVALGRPPDKSHLQTFNRFLAEFRLPEVILWRGSDFLRSGGNLAERPEGPLWPLIDAAAQLLTSQERHHIRECSEKSCRWLFLDHSKNHSRRWCDMRLCGNRSKAQRFYARQRSGEMER